MLVTIGQREQSQSNDRRANNCVSMSSIKTTEKEGDVSIGRHVGIGGNAREMSSCIWIWNEGWLDAKNIKGVLTGISVESCVSVPTSTWWLVGYRVLSHYRAPSIGETVWVWQRVYAHQYLKDANGTLRVIDDERTKRMRLRKSLRIWLKRHEKRTKTAAP